MPTPLRTLAACALLALPAALLSACQDPFGHTIHLKAQYTGLKDQTVAVVVSVPRHILDPVAAHDIGAAMTYRIVDNYKQLKIPVTVVPFSRVQAFVDENPYWALRRPSAVLKSLGVSRLVWVDVAEFRTHEDGAGNDLLNGLAVGYVRVLEAESADSDRFAFSQATETHYPLITRVGAEGIPRDHNGMSEAQVRANLIQLFSLQAAGAFYDHEETR